MRKFSLKPAIMVCAFALIIAAAGYAQAVEIHIVGDAAYKYAGGVWTQTAPERLGDLTAIWALSESDMFMGTADGYVYRFDGFSWSETIHVAGSPSVRSIWGTSSSNVYVCAGNSFLRFDGAVWSEIDLIEATVTHLKVYGMSADDIYMIAYDDTLRNLIYHYDGGDPTSWELANLTSLGISMNCTAVWGSAGDDVFVGGSLGEIIHWDGQSWELSLSGGGYIYDIWGASANDVFAVRFSSIIHYDGSAWTAMSVPGAYSLNWIAGWSASEVIAGGGYYDIHYYNGSVWTKLSYNEGIDTNDACAISSGNTLIVARDGKMFRFNGSTVERCETDWWCASLAAVSGTPSGRAFSVGDLGFVYHYDGSAWREMGRPTTKNLTDVVAFAYDDVCVSGPGETFRYNGTSWEKLGGDASAGGGLWGFSSDDLYAASGSRIYHYDGAAWTSIYYKEPICYNPPTCNLSTYYYFTSIWGTATNNIYAGGYKETHDETDLGYPLTYRCPILIHYDGSEWTFETFYYTCPTDYYWPSDNARITEIWGSSASDIWAGGTLSGGYSPGVLKYFEDNEWGLVQTPFHICEGIWGDADGTNTYFLDGDAGDVYCYANLVWSSWNVTNMYMRDMCAAGFSDTLTGGEAPMPLENVLRQNHPNPFNPVTTIRFSLRARGRASLVVYDLAGRLVRGLVNDVLEAGPHEIMWDGRDSKGRAVASGVYFYRLEAGEFVDTKKMVLLR